MWHPCFSGGCFWSAYYFDLGRLVLLRFYTTEIYVRSMSWLAFTFKNSGLALSKPWIPVSVINDYNSQKQRNLTQYNITRKTGVLGHISKSEYATIIKCTQQSQDGTRFLLSYKTDHSACFSIDSRYKTLWNRHKITFDKDG